MIDRRNGTIRSKRTLSNLLDSPFQIDQRSFCDLMGYLSSFLENINYYNLQNEPQHEPQDRWIGLLAQDPIMYMVSIVNDPLTDINLMMQYCEGTVIDGYDDLVVITKLLERYKKIDKWHSTLLVLKEKKLAYKIKNILNDVLTYEKDVLFQHQQKLLSKRKQNKEKTVEALPGVMALPLPAPTGEFDLGKVVHNFRKVVTHLQNYTRRYLEQHIFASNRHAPHNAMYIAFIELFKTVQKKLNTLSQRHIDFYFKDILQQTNNPGRPTKAIVNFDLIPKIDYTLIEKDTRLSAGRLFGGKTDIIFKTEKPLVACQVELVELQTLLFDANPYIKIGTDMPLISSVSKNRLISKGKVVNSGDEWFVFGANKQSIQNAQINAGKVAQQGFIIASPVLLLDEGRREIDIHVNFDKDSTQNPFFQLLNEISNNRKISPETAFSDVFRQGLKIFHTSQKGWTRFENYGVEVDHAGNNFSIKLILENAAPALEKTTKVREKISWPAIKVELNEYAPVYLYSFFKGVQIDNIRIDVNVQRIRNLSLYNNIGKMPLGKPFELFGTMPAEGSYLLIGKSELFQKSIDTVEVILEWESVPSVAGGFDAYYSGYPENIGNDSFKVQFTVLSGGYWLPADLTDAQFFNLFSTSKYLTPEGYEHIRLNNSSIIKLDKLADLEIPPDFDLKAPLKYTITTQSGFIKLALVSPVFGFGSELFQKEFTAIATYNAKNENQLEYPNKPFIPKVKGISVNYKATDTLYFEKEFSNNTNTGEFMHITPFGVEQVIANQSVMKHTLFGNFEAEGYLFLGLSGIKINTTLSIYFHFLHSSTGVNIQENQLIWEYFQLGKWIKFEPSEIVLDETNGFTKSGIIELALPKLDAAENDIQDDIYWIRISVKDNTPHYPVIKGIYLNAVEVTCINTDALVIGKEVPPGSINKLVGKFPDVKKVSQPSTSAGGVLPESEDRFYSRVSERLRHKSRAVTIWDYERLILENFDDVRVVKCTNFDQSFKPVPGVVKVIVLSAKWTNNERQYFSEDKLDAMKRFLERLSSTFIDIQVINPTVEYLLVNCAVVFMLADNGGYYIGQLNKDISNYLSPIANGDNGIGGSVVPTMLVSFLENLPYIKKIEKLTVEHIVRHKINTYSLGVYRDGEEIKTTTPWSILSPVNQHHIINLINEDQVHESLDVGIGNMKIGNDLILGDASASTSDTIKPPEEAKLPNDAIFVFEHKSNDT